MEQESALSRVFEAADCKTQVALAALLGIQQSSISAAKRRGSIPAEWLIKLLRFKRINPEWILTGRGSKYLESSTGSSHTASGVPGMLSSLREYSTQELAAELVRRARN